MTGPVGGVSPAIDTLVSVFLFEGRATTVGGMRSVSEDSAACLGSATAAFPTDRKVRLRHRNLPYSSRFTCFRHKVSVQLSLKCFSFLQVPDVNLTGTVGHPCAALGTTANRCARDV